MPHHYTSRERRRRAWGATTSLGNILWLVVVVIVVLWLSGLVGGIGGSLIHTLPVIALLVVVFNLIAGRRMA